MSTPASPPNSNNTGTLPPPQDAYVLGRLLMFQSPNGVAASIEPWKTIADILERTASSQRHTVFEAELAARGLDIGAVSAEILSHAGSPSQPPPPAGPSQVPSCPPLPRGVQLDPALGVGASPWLDQYTTYADTISPMTPRLFHEFAGLWLPSVAIARRLYIPMAYDVVFPNIFGLQIAKTTLFRKSTGLNITSRFARRAFPHLLAPQDVTPEAFLAQLAGQKPNKFDDLPIEIQQAWYRGRNFAAQRGLILDEASGLFAAAGKDYNAGLVESVLRLYDCTPEFNRLTRGQGLLVIRASYFSILGASTPRAMALFLSDERLWGMGMWPRAALLTPDCEQPAWREPQDIVEPPDLLSDLQELHDRLPAPTWPDSPKATPVSLGTGVFDAWNKYNKAVSYDLLTPEVDNRLLGTYGRMPTQLLKVATLLAALDWPQKTPAPRIQLHHLAQAMTIVEEWRASAHRALEMAAASDYGDLRQRIMRQISRAGTGGITKRELCRAIGDKRPDDIEDALRQMVDAGDIDKISVAGAGRPTTKYRIA